MWLYQPKGNNLRYIKKMELGKKLHRHTDTVAYFVEGMVNADFHRDNTKIAYQFLREVRTRLDNQLEQFKIRNIIHRKPLPRRKP